MQHKTITIFKLYSDGEYRLILGENPYHTIITKDDVRYTFVRDLAPNLQRGETRTFKLLPVPENGPETAQTDQGDSDA